MKREDLYQYCLVGCALIVLTSVTLFVYREMFPEYKTYQKAYEKLEAFRSSYTHEKPAPFYKGVKQILINSETEGKETLDRCICCHLATDLPHFSPTKIAHDVNNKIMRDEKGNPILEPNPDYVFER